MRRQHLAHIGRGLMVAGIVLNIIVAVPTVITGIAMNQYLPIIVCAGLSTVLWWIAIRAWAAITDTIAKR